MIEYLDLKVQGVFFHEMDIWLAEDGNNVTARDNREASNTHED
jgi:hypothetical protein